MYLNYINDSYYLNLFTHIFQTGPNTIIFNYKKLKVISLKSLCALKK